MAEDEGITGDPDTVCRVFEQSPVGIMALRGREHITWASNAAYRALLPLWRVGVPIVELAPATEPFVEVFDRVWDSGASVEISEWRVQYDPDGSGELIERYADLGVSPIRDPDGTMVGVEVTVADSSDAVHARQAEQRRADEMTDRYLSARDAVVDMQKALLPTSTPILPGVDVAAAYLVATEDTAAGGDWFDAIPTDDGRLFLVLGDVVGHGVAAAAVMAQLRSVTRMQLQEGVGVASAVEAVDRFAHTVPGARSATLCIGELDTATGCLEYCTAGHPPPIAIGAVGPARFLEPTGTQPLGNGRLDVRTLTVHLDDAESVVFYSDGIIERPGRAPSQSSVELVSMIGHVMHDEHFPLDPRSTPVERLCAQTIELLIRTTGFRDDVTLLAAQRRRVPAPVGVTVRADATAERAIRARVREWAATVALPDVEVSLLEHSVTEYVANTVRHAYADGEPGDLTFALNLSNDGRVRAVVSDNGRWRDPLRDSVSGGRGLAIARSLVPDTTIDRDDTGTTVTLHHRPGRPARVLVDPTPGFVARRPVDVACRISGSGENVVVAGDVDSMEAASLAGTLAGRSHAGTSRLNLDLTDVTHFGSAAVAALAEHLETTSRHGPGTTIIAAPGTIAHHILTVAGILPQASLSATTR